MKQIAFYFILTCAWCVQASAATSFTAGDVENSCKPIALSQPNDKYCLTLIHGYVDGMRSGANRGLRTAFIQDEKNLETTQGIDDVRLRISRLRSQAACIPSQATVKQVADVFLKYVAAHPSRRNEPYQEVLLDAMESHYCP
jgi:hypothetical protein